MSGNFRQEGNFVQTGDWATVSDDAPFASGQLGKIGYTPSSTAVFGEVPTQYVLRYATDTVAMTQGDVAFWQDPTNFVVTGEAASAIGGTTAPLVAGVFGAATPAAGKYGFIQVGGQSAVRILDSTSSSTVGVPLVWSTTNLLRQATAQDSNRQIVGIVKTLTTSTGTHLSVSAILTVPRLGW